MPISTLPTPPSRADDPSNFSSKSDALLGGLPTFVTEANALQADVNTKQATASTAATTATTQATNASTSATNAASSATTASTAATTATTQAGIATTKAGEALTSATAAATNAASVASGLASIAGGPVASVNGETGIVTLKTVNGTAIVGSGDITAGASVVRSARTSNTIIGTADKGALIDITSGTFSQTFTAAATLGSGWYCYIKNSGTGDITLDPNSAELIDGLASYVMYPGELRLVQCDGTGFNSAVITPFYKTFTASGNFIKPPGYARFDGLIWAAGGSGGKDTSSSNLKRGGCGGACAPIAALAADLSTTSAVVIGSGGAAKTTTSDGAAGGNSSVFGLTAYGGAGGQAAANSNGPSSIVSSGLSDANPVTGGCSSTQASQTLYGGGSNAPAALSLPVFGAPGGGQISAAAAITQSPASAFGAARVMPSITAGVDGNVPGGGGAPTTSGTQSGAGARGELRIWGVA